MAAQSYLANGTRQVLGDIPTSDWTLVSCSASQAVATVTVTQAILDMAGSVGLMLYGPATPTAVQDAYTNVGEVKVGSVTTPVTSTAKKSTGGGDGSGSQSVTVGDFVWLDANHNGVQDTGEAGIPGVVLKVTGPSGAVTDINGAAVGPQTTDVNGKYSFALLPALAAGQSYTVTVDAAASAAALAGKFPTLTGAGTGATDSSTSSAASGDLTVNGTSDLTLDFGYWTPAPAISITKSDAQGNAADTSAAAVSLGSEPGSASLVYTITNTGNEPITTIVVSDQVITNGTVTGLACTFPGGGGGTMWAGPLAVGASFTCTAQLSGVTAAGGLHQDVGSVIGVGQTSGIALSAQNPYFATTTPLVSIGDHVWFDADRNGVQDAGELPAPGVTVKLYDRAGAPVATTTTDGSGFYSFGGLIAGAPYVVEFVAPAGSSFTTANAGSADGVDSDADVSTGRVSVTAPSSGANSLAAPDDPTIDAGLIRYNLVLSKALATTGQVVAGSTVTFTLTPHNDGPVNALAGWSVTDVLPTGLTLVSMSGTGYTCTGATCVASAGLPAGANGGMITVTATVDPGFSGPAKNVAYVTPATGDGPETNPLVVPTTTTDTSTTTTDNDAQAEVGVASLVSIGDVVWWDKNRDGVQNDNAPAAGVTVNLRSADGSSVLASTVTNATGFYSFTGLTPGAPYVVEFVKPASTGFTTANAGSDDLLDSDADVTTGRVSVTAPAAGTNSATSPDGPSFDAGLVEINLLLFKTPAGVGTVYEGDVVTYELTPTNSGRTDALAGWSITEVMPDGLLPISMSGAGYTCSGQTCVASAPLAAGATGGPIQVVAKVAPDFVGTLKNVAYVSPAATDVVETIPLVVPTTTTDTETTPTDNDSQATLTVASLVSIGDFVWWDNNRNGAQDSTEPVASGVVVNLYDATGTKVSSTTTDAQGYYAFGDLRPLAHYTVEFVRPALASFTTTGGGTAATDSDADRVTGRVAVIAPAVGVNRLDHGLADDPTIDAGLVEFNLTLAKEFAGHHSVAEGDEVTFLLTPHNVGPSDALAGWSVTDLLPRGLELVSMSGKGYTCTDNTCVAAAPLAANASGAVIRVVAKVEIRSAEELHNVAYVAPAAGDIPEDNPLVIPTDRTDTTSTSTDNDAQASIRVHTPDKPERDDSPDRPSRPEPLALTGSDDVTSIVWFAGVTFMVGLVMIGVRRLTRNT